MHQCINSFMSYSLTSEQSLTLCYPFKLVISKISDFEFYRVPLRCNRTPTVCMLQTMRKCYKIVILILDNFRLRYLIFCYNKIVHPFVASESNTIIIINLRFSSAVNNNKRSVIKRNKICSRTIWFTAEISHQANGLEESSNRYYL